MGIEQFTKDYWYSARYESGFSIIFQVLEADKEGLTLYRKDGAIVDTIPEGYEEIVSHGNIEPEYE